MSKARTANLALRLESPLKAGPLELQLTLPESASILEAAEASALRPGTYARRVVTSVFGEEATLENVKLHAKEMNLPVSVLCRILVLAASGHPSDDQLETYKALARRAGKELRHG